MTPHETIVVQVDAELEALIPRFLSNQQKALATMCEALQQQDYATIRTAGHNIKGSAGGYGFDAMTDMGSALEQAAKTGNDAAITTWLASLTHYLAHLEIVYA